MLYGGLNMSSIMILLSLIMSNAAAAFCLPRPPSHGVLDFLAVHGTLSIGNNSCCCVGKLSGDKPGASAKGWTVVHRAGSSVRSGGQIVYILC